MSESTGIAEYERRIAAALDRIAAVGDRVLLSMPAQPPADTDALREALEAERATSAQLAERLNSVKSAREALSQTVADLTAQVETLRAEVAELQAARENDQSEIAAVLAALAPLVQEAGHA